MAKLPDPALEQLIAALRGGDLDFADPPAKVRATFEATLATIPVAEDIVFSDCSLGGVPALKIVPPGAARECVLLYLHGGGYIAGSASGYRGLAAELCRAAGMTGVSIDYRLAPENPFPAAVLDATAAYEALMAEGYAPGDVVVAGDSAGGGLAVSLLLSLRDKGIGQPRAALAISPWADMACDAASYRLKAAEDPSLTPEGLARCAHHYLAGNSAAEPLASPARADLSGLAPLLIQVGSAEILMDDAINLARAAGLAGVETRLEIWPQMIHVWHAFGFLLEEGRRAIAAAGAFLAQAR